MCGASLRARSPVPTPCHLHSNQPPAKKRRWGQANGRRWLRRINSVATERLKFIRNTVRCLLALMHVWMRSRWGSSVSTGCGLNDRGSIPVMAVLLSAPQRPDRHWGSTSLLSNGYRVISSGAKRLEREANHSPPPNPEVKNVWNYTSTSTYVCMPWRLVKRRRQIYHHLYFGCIHRVLKVHSNDAKS
jgi:hypothetical protein